MQSQEEISKLLDCTFAGKREITMSEFKEITEKVTSAIYLCVMKLDSTLLALFTNSQKMSDLRKFLRLLQQKTARAFEE